MLPSSLSSQLRFATLLPLLLTFLLFDFLYIYELSYTTNQKQQQVSTAYLKQLLPSIQLALFHHETQTLQELIDTTTINTDIDALSIYDERGVLLTYRGTPITLSHKHFNKLDPTKQFIKLHQDRCGGR